MAIKTVALVGASGTLGPFILEALRASETLQTTVLVRESSKSTFANGVLTRKIPDDLEPQETLVAALKGQDAIILAFPGGSTSQSKLIIDAAIKAGVKRIIPADFGSCDSSDPRSLEIVPLYKEKEKVRNYLIERQGQGDGLLTWTSLITGHFFDYGLQSPLLGLDLKSGKARVFDGGDKWWSATTRGGIGTAVRKILESAETEEKTRNKLVYVQQVRTTQNQLIATLENIQGRSYEIEHIDSEKFIKDHKKKLHNVDGTTDGHVVEELVCVEGLVNGDWQYKDTLINDLLDIPIEQIDVLVRKLMQE